MWFDTICCEHQCHCMYIFCSSCLSVYGKSHNDIWNIAVIVVDADSLFFNDFQNMCTILQIHFWTLSWGNHKGNITLQYHRFLNKTHKIWGNNCGTYQWFLENAKTTQFAWNSSTIDNTDILRSLPAVGREFKLPLDFECTSLPSLNDPNNLSLYNYLCHISTNLKFATNFCRLS